MAEKKTLIGTIEKLNTTQKATIKKIESLESAIIDLIQVIAETEMAPKITVQTSTAEEIKQALKPISREIIMERGR